MTDKIGAKSYISLAYMDLELLYRAKKETVPARKSISKSIELSDQCEAEVYLQQAREALASLN